MAFPRSFIISSETPSGLTDLFSFQVSATLSLMILVSMIKGAPELAHCICWVLPSLLNTEQYYLLRELDFAIGSMMSRPL